MLKQIRDKAEEHGTPLALCGEMAGRPLQAMALLGLGYRTISMSRAAIGPVKAMLLELDLVELQKLMDEALQITSPDQTMIELLTDFADRHGIPY